MNKLYFGDNLDVMKRIYHDEHQAEFIDLIYNDPPFNSKRNSRAIFPKVLNTKKYKYSQSKIS